MRALTRTRLLQLALAATGALLVDPRAALAQLRAPSLARLSIRNAGRRYAGDRRLFATVSPGVAGRDTATVAFVLDRPANVQLEAVSAGSRSRRTVWRTRKRFAAGAHRLSWRPDAKTEVGAYQLRLTVEDKDGQEADVRSAAAGEADAHDRSGRAGPRRRSRIREAQLRAA